MCRKIAFGITVTVTAILMVLRLGLVPFWNTLQIGSVDAAHLMPMVLIVIIIALAILCRFPNQELHQPAGMWSSVCGWFSTFCGAVLAMSVLLDIFCWVVYNQVPPPNTEILNQIDMIALILMLLFGALSGSFLILQGFRWMASLKQDSPLIPWLSITPALWMWFRLARYEISYASTIDISENVFNFAILIFASLFFLQFARMMAGIGKTPKSSLLIFSLCTAIVALSGAPTAFIEVSDGEPLGKLLLVIVDTATGLFALIFAAMQIFSQPEDSTEPVTDGKEPVSTDEDNSLAWSEPEHEQEQLNPPFDIDSLLPEDITTAKAKPAQPSATVSNDVPTLTVDDILSEIDKSL